MPLRFPIALIAASVLLVLFILTGCGMPGAPQPPSLQLARPVEDLTASRKGNKVHLEWTLPRKNTDRTLVKDVPETIICRNLGTELMSNCADVARVENPKFEEVKKGEKPQVVRVKYDDTLPTSLDEQHPAGFVRYAVEVLNARGRSAGLSNQVLIPVAPTIDPPAELTVKVEADGVLVAWTGATVPEAPDGLTYRYRIERSVAGANAYIGLADVEPGAEGSYLDKTFAWETKFDYRITTMTEVRAKGLDMTVEGADSKAVEVFTRDVYPPAEPTGLQAVYSSVGQKPFIDLTWAPNMESDLAGYNVYRSETGGEAVKLNAKPQPVPAYRDETVLPGKTYVYSVTAVDVRGNESPKSVEAKETAAR